MMPTKEQVNAAILHIADVIGRRYIEGNGDMCSCWFQPEGGGPLGIRIVQGVPVGTPEPFSDLPVKARIELLDVYVDWEGFDNAQESSVIQRVLDGESPEFWMDDIQITDEQSLPQENQQTVCAERQRSASHNMFNAIMRGDGPTLDPTIAEPERGIER